MLDTAEGVVEVGGRRVGYLLRGPAGGDVVVHLHGMPSCRREQLLFPDDSLERLSVRLLSIDRPGWGQTDPLPGDRVARTADVVPVCDALGVGPFCVMGISAGGSYALTLAATAGERVTRVVLVAAQMPYDDRDAIRDLLPDQLALVPLLEGGRTPALVDAVEQWRQAVLADPFAALATALGSLTERERALIEDPAFRQKVLDEMREGVRACGDGALDDLLGWPHPFEVDLSAIRCPVLAFHGTLDVWEPLANLRRILDRIDGAQLLLAEGLNHFAPLLYPDVALALTRAQDR